MRQLTPTRGRFPASYALGVRGWLVVGAIWTGFGLLESLKAYVINVALGHARPVADLLTVNLPWWMCWAALTPLVFTVSRRWPLAPEGRTPAAVLVHAPAAFVFSLIHLSVTLLVFRHTVGSDVPLGLMWAQWVNVFLFLEIFTYASVVAAHHAIVHYRLYRERQDAATRLELAQERLRTEAARAKLQSLQMELQPHFLFNTFNAIAALVRRNENAAAVEMLVRLGELLRQTLEHGETPRIRLDEELELARCYLGIQQVRFPGLRVTSDVGPEANRALVPTLLLQPLLENAVRYGLSPSGAAHVRLRAKVAEGRLRVEVEDPGSGGGGAGDGDGHGIGLANTRARLEQLWGADARVALDRLATGGMRVVLDVPFVPADPEGDEPRHARATWSSRPRAAARGLGVNPAPGAV